MSAYSLTDARDQFLQWIAQHRRPRTAENYTRYLDRFIKSVNVQTLDQLAPLHLMRWGRTWHQIQAVQRWINWAVTKAKIMDANPFKGVERPRLGIRKRILNDVERVALMRRSKPSYRRFLVALRETMARPQEVRELCWEEIAWEEKPRGIVAALRSGLAYFVLEEFKARDRRLDPDAPRVIPISPRLGRLLARLRTRCRVTEGRIFRNDREEDWTPNALRCRMRRLRKRVGIQRDRRGKPSSLTPSDIPERLKPRKPGFGIGPWQICWVIRPRERQPGINTWTFSIWWTPWRWCVPGIAPRRKANP